MALTTNRGQAKEKRVKLVFVRNTSYEGTEYGPGYQDKAEVVDVGESWARQFLRSGRAVPAGEYEGGPYDKPAKKAAKKGSKDED